MKKSFLTLIPALAIIAVTMSSCADNCCTAVGGVLKYCEDDYEASGYDSWEEAKEALSNSGWNCD